MENELNKFLNSLWENLSTEDEKQILNKISKILFYEELRNDQKSNLIYINY